MKAFPAPILPFIIYPDITMNEELKARLLGEAKFLRAFYYFHLTNIFGNIPLKLNPPLTQADINVPASDVSADLCPD